MGRRSARRGADDGRVPDQDTPPSKSAKKREMTALQQLGERLCTLSPGELARIPVDDPALLEAIDEVRSIHSNSARRRHLQFIGRLMRGVDPVPIEAALQDLHRERSEEAERLHRLEAWRDRILARGEPAIEEALAAFPGADRQRLRQLVLQHRRERTGDGPPAAARALFRYLRDSA